MYPCKKCKYGWGCTVIIMHLCLANYLSLFSISFLFCMGMATIQLWLRTWFRVLSSCAWHSSAQQPSQRGISADNLDHFAGNAALRF